MDKRRRTEESVDGPLKSGKALEKKLAEGGEGCLTKGNCEGIHDKTCKSSEASQRRKKKNVS